MVKNERKKPSDFATLKSVGRGLKEVFMAATTHPAIPALLIMTGCVIGKMALYAKEPRENLKKGYDVIGGTYFYSTDPKVDTQLNTLQGLYSGAQGIAMASAVVPAVQAGLQAVTAFAPKGAAAKATAKSTD